MAWMDTEYIYIYIYSYLDGLDGPHEVDGRISAVGGALGFHPVESSAASLIKLLPHPLPRLTSSDPAAARGAHPQQLQLQLRPF